MIVIGKLLKLSPAFPPLHTVQAGFPAYGVLTNPIHSIIFMYMQRRNVESDSLVQTLLGQFIDFYKLGWCQLRWYYPY